MLNTKTGFSLIELMVVIAIIAVLAAIAAPAYKTYIRNAKIGSATPMIYRLQELGWEYYNSHHTFANDLSKLGYSYSGTTSPTPVTANDYVFPYVAVIGTDGIPYSPGSCAKLSSYGFLSNLSQGLTFSASNDYIELVLESYDVNGIQQTVCSFFDVTSLNGGGVDATTEIPGCYNHVNSSEQATYADLTATYSTACP